MDLDNRSVIYKTDNNSTFLPICTFVSSTLGMILSIAGLMILIMTALFFAEWRHNYKNQLLIQFMIARFLYTLVRYFYDVSNFLYISYFYPIYLDAMPMAYSEMALVTWMFVFSKQMYDNFVRVCNIGSESLLKVSLSAWLIPAIVSIFLYVSYNIQNNRDLQFFLLYLFLLKWPVLCANGILLVSVLKYIISCNKSKTENNRRIVIVMITLIFSFCFQQALNDAYKLFYVIFNFNNNVVYTPIFFVLTNILTTYHCAFSIFFWLFANRRTRILWKFTNEQNNDAPKQTVHTICNTTS